MSTPPAPASATTRRSRSRKETRLTVSRYFSKMPKFSRKVEVVIQVRKRKRSKNPAKDHPAFYRDARRTLHALTDDEDVRAEQKALMRRVPGYAPFFSTYFEARQRLLVAKPVLIQECVRDDPWKLLIAAMFLNRTRGKYSVPIFWQLMERWPTPETMAHASPIEIATLIHCLGLQNMRARRLVKLSQLYLTNPPVPPSYKAGLQSKYYTEPGSVAALYAANFALARKQTKSTGYPVITPVSHFPGFGSYALDSYRIFCGEDEEWKKVMPEDKELVRYLKWRWAVEVGVKWPPNAKGKLELADEVYLDLLADELVKFDPYEGM